MAFQKQLLKLHNYSDMHWWTYSTSENVKSVVKEFITKSTGPKVLIVEERPSCAFTSQISGII